MAEVLDTLREFGVSIRVHSYPFVVFLNPNECRANTFRDGGGGFYRQPFGGAAAGSGRSGLGS